MKRIDWSLVSLVVTNAVALGLAAREGVALETLLMMFWAQNVIIGVIHLVRLYLLERFSTRNVRINRRRVEPTPETKHTMMFIFGMMFFMSHGLYFGILLTFWTPVMDAAFWYATLGFAANHLFSFYYNRQKDRQGRPNIGTMVGLPILRILPMHACVWVGMVFDRGLMTLILFGALKTLADGAMHLWEHRVYRRRS